MSFLTNLFARLCPGRSDNNAILQRIAQMETNIMSAISDFAAKQAAFNTRQAAAVDSIVASQAGITADLTALNDKITALQNSAGAVTPEDQKLIDELEAQGEALASKNESVAAALKALDAMNPPPAPVAA